MSNPSSVVRSIPHPVLEDGNFSFLNGSYTVTTEVSGNSGTKVILQHTVAGAPFVENLVATGKAKYACLVSVPKTGYRKLEISNESTQEIGWDLGIAGEPPMLRPLVLFVGEKCRHRLTEADGVAKIWQGRTIEIEKGSRLARGRYRRPSASIENLLSVRLDENRPNGSFAVAANTNEGFYFIMNAAPDLFYFIQNSQGNPLLRASILTHAVSQCLTILKNDFGEKEDDEDSDDHWNQHRTLVDLSEWLKGKVGMHWSDEKFDAVDAATRLYPIQVPNLDGGEK